MAASNNIIGDMNSNLTSGLEYINLLGHFFK